MRTKPLTIGFVHNAYPVLSQTFIKKEMLGLRELGLPLKIYSLLYPPDVQEKKRDEPQDVTYVLPRMRVIALFFAHLYFMITSPRTYGLTFIFVLKTHTTRAEMRQYLVMGNNLSDLHA